MRYYVYALIDPTRGNTPFYIGKGLDNRLQVHFKAAERLAMAKGVEVIGCDPHSVLEDAEADQSAARLARINELKRKGFDHTHIARVIARRLDERTAFAVEAFLIHRIYGVRNLTNRVEGMHTYRFREHNVDSFIDGFDIDIDVSNVQLSEIEARFGKYYVYTLRDPASSRVFYVGKGTERRMFAHFAAAKAGDQHRDGHVLTLSTLLENGHQPADICRVEARLDCEQQAFALEALLLKFVYGFTTVENRVAGHHGQMFRAKDDWEKRHGFDLPYVCNPGKPTDRADKLDGMIGEGLAIPLHAIEAAFSELTFDPPKVLDAADLSIEADLVPQSGGEGARVKVFIRRQKMQVELRPRRRAQREWVRSHFSRLGAYPLRRKDDVFLPGAWRGSANMTDDLDQIAHRVRLLQEIVNATDVDSLSDEAKSLLPHRGVDR